MAAAIPHNGPITPTSKSCRRFMKGVRILMNAPMVPKFCPRNGNEGNGMGKGGVERMPYLQQAMKWPISWHSRMNSSAAA